MMDESLLTDLAAILERLLGAGDFKAALLHDRRGNCIASSGDRDAMAAVADTHFGTGLELRHLCRDSDGSTVLSESSGDAVRLEAVAGSYILTLVCPDPLMGRHLRSRIDHAKRMLERRLAQARSDL
jgi:hypothetical protein